MKCQKCGQNEANCHYTMRVNGKGVECHLCSRCAGELGIEQDFFGDFSNMFDDMFSDFFGARRGRSLFDSFGFGFPSMTMPRLEILLDGCAPGTEEKPEEKTDTSKEGTDPEMSRKRQLNMLRHKMKRAAAEENFEEAAKLRDEIKALEAKKD